MHLRVIEAWLRREHFLADDFRFSRWECFPHGAPTIYTEIEGSRCPLVLTGKRKGLPNWMKRTETRVFYVSEIDVARIESEYESDTGNCRHCGGDATDVSNVNFVTHVTTYKPCGKCGGTGRCISRHNTNEVDND